MHFQLARLLESLEAAGLLAGQRGPLPDEVHGLTDDSRSVEPGSIFLAVRGSARDGHDYLAKAAEKGASVAMVEDPERTAIPVIIVREGRKAAAVAAGTAYGDP